MNMHLSAAALATAPVLSVLQAHDPIYAAISEHRRAFAARIAALNAEGLFPPHAAAREAAARRMAETASIEHAARNKLLATAPTTVDGLSAHAAHLRVIATETDEDTEEHAAFKQAFLAVHASAVALVSEEG